MITYRIASFSEVWEDVKELLILQWEEVDHRRKTSKLNIMEDWYKSVEKNGMHFVAVAEDDDKIIGYSSMFITQSPHTTSLHVASDVMYVIDEYRHSGVGTGLIKASEEEGIKRGAEHIMVTLKNDKPHENLVDDLGFFSYETVYSKVLVGEI